MVSSASSLWFHVASATQRDKQYRWMKERGKETTEKKALYVSVRADKRLKIQLVLSLPGGKEEGLMGIMSGNNHRRSMSITQHLHTWLLIVQ